MAAFDVQVGGDHYKNYKVQPMYFGMLNHFDPCLYGIFKYVLRHRHKGQSASIKKAMHSVSLREEAAKCLYVPEPLSYVAMAFFIAENEIDCGYQQNALLHLEAYAHHRATACKLIETIKAMGEHYYGRQDEMDLFTS